MCETIKFGSQKYESSKKKKETQNDLNTCKTGKPIYGAQNVTNEKYYFNYTNIDLSFNV